MSPVNKALRADADYRVERYPNGFARSGQIRFLVCAQCDFRVDVIALHRHGDRSGAGRYCRARGRMVKHIHAEHKAPINAKRPPQDLPSHEGQEAGTTIVPTPEVSHSRLADATQVTPLEIGIECKKIIALEGGHHVYGHYYGDIWDAAIARNTAAERKLRLEKVAAFHARFCCWCETELGDRPSVCVGSDRKVCLPCLPAVTAFLDPEGGSLVAVLSRAVA